MAETVHEPTDGDERGAAAPAKPRRKPASKPTSKPGPPRQLPPINVILHNDDVNSADEVVESIVMLTPLKEQEATLRTKEAHRQGQSLLLTTHKERAELYQQQFASRNLTVTLEPA